MKYVQITDKQKAAGTSTNVEQKVTLLHVGGKVGAVKWDVAQYKNKDAAADLNAVTLSTVPIVFLV
jgi:hypothetical protein